MAAQLQGDSVNPAAAQREGNFISTFPRELREMVYGLLLDASPRWLFPLYFPHDDDEDYDGPPKLWKNPRMLLHGQALLLVSRQVSREALGVLYGRNRFHLEAWAGTNNVPRWLAGIGANLQTVSVLSVNLCNGMDRQRGFVGMQDELHGEFISSWFDDFVDPPQEPDYATEILARERNIKADMVRMLRLLAGVGRVHMKVLELLLPGWEQGGKVMYGGRRREGTGLAYLMQNCFTIGLLADADVVDALRAIGPVGTLRLGRLWDGDWNGDGGVEAAVSLAREMGVANLVVMDGLEELTVSSWRLRDVEVGESEF